MVCLASISVYGLAVPTRLTPAVSAAAAAAPVGGVSSSAPDDLSAAAAARRSGSRVLVSGSRSERAETYANPDGTFTQEVAASPVRAPQGQGWAPIDTTLVSDSAGVHPKVALGGTVLSGGGSAAAVRAVLPGGRNLVLSWLSSLPRPTLSGDTATYPGVLPGADLVVTAKPSGFELSVLLRQRPSVAFGSLRLPLDIPGASVATTAAGGLVVTDSSTHEVIAEGPTPMVWGADRDGNGLPGHVAKLGLSVVADKAGTALLLAPDMAFLADPAVQYPVTIDPSLTYNRASDTYVEDGAAASSNYTSLTDLLAGRRNTASGGRTSRSLLTFNPGGLAGRHALSVQLKLNNTGSATCTAGSYPLFVDRVTGAWSPSGVTWNTQPTVAASSIGQNTSQVFGMAACPANVLTFDSANGSAGLLSTVQGWLDGTTANYGLRLHTTETTTQTLSYRRFDAGEAANTALTPKLIINYNSYPNTVAGRSTTPTQTNGGTLYAQSKTPTLRGAVLDVDGGQSYAHFEVYNTAGSLVTYGDVPGGPENSPMAWQVPGGALVEGGQYRWRALGFDGVDYSKNWSSYVPFTVDTTPPPAPSIGSLTYPRGVWSQPSGNQGDFTLGAGSVNDLDHFLYSLDGPVPDTVASSVLTLAPGDGWHTLRVVAVDHAGNLSAASDYSFGATPAVSSPVANTKTRGQVALDALFGPGNGSVTYNYRRDPTGAWSPLPTGDVKQGGTVITGWPVSFPVGSADSTPPELVWDLAHTLNDQDGPVQLQVCFAGSCSAASTTVTLDANAFGDSYATAGVGPGSVSLLTGNYSIAGTDANVDAAGGNLTVARTFNSKTPSADGPFGRGWIASLPVDGAGGDFTGLTDTGGAVTLTGTDGATTSFAAKAGGGYAATGDDADSGLSLTATAGSPAPTGFTLTDLDGTSTVFTAAAVFGAAASVTSPHAYTVSSVRTTASASMSSYVTVAGRVQTVTAPVPPNGSCTDPASVATWTAGCRQLAFRYDPSGHALAVTFVSNPTGGAVLQVDVACYAYNTGGQLTQAWDPRAGSPVGGGHPVVCGSPVLPVSYGYDPAGRIASVTPPGLQLWTLTYDMATGRFVSAARSHAGGGTETSSVVYGVPLTADTSATAGSPDLTAAGVSGWGQTDVPVTATAVFGPGEAALGTDLRGGELHYLDINGREVNTAQYAGTGAAGWHITTTEYDSHGNAIRGLSAANREEALNPTGPAATLLGVPAGTSSATLASWLDERSVYRADPTDGVLDLTDTFGPYHRTVAPDGSIVAARAHATNSYDTGGEPGHPAGRLHLAVSSSTAASVSPQPVPTGEVDRRTVTTDYALSATDNVGWALRQPMRTVTDPGTLNITTITHFNSHGDPTQTQLPADAAAGSTGSTAGATDTVYYTAGPNTDDADCGNKPQWVTLTCKTRPHAQPGVAGLPGLVTTWVSQYDYLNRPTSTAETVTDASGAVQTRTVSTSYAGGGYDSRVAGGSITGGLGTAVPATTVSYDPGTGLPTRTDAAATATQSATLQTTGYDDFGRPTAYSEDGTAAGTTSTAYDPTTGRVSAVTDPKGSRSLSYNGSGEHRGLPTGLTVSGITGSFKLSYDGDGKPSSQDWPNGMTQTFSYDETGDRTALTDTAPGGNSVWLSDTQTPSVHGQNRLQASTLSSQAYSYDNLGRLTGTVDQANDSNGVACTTRAYTFDLNSNRLTSASSPPTADGSCQTLTASTTKHEYDTADRLLSAAADTGVAYDAYGRTTTLPAADTTGTGNLTAGYYSNDLVRTQSQNGRTLTWTLDAAGRLKSRTDSSTTTSQVNHYTGSGDSPGWIDETGNGTSFTRNITDLTGNFAATLDQTGGLTWQLSNLHGDINAVTPNGGTPSYLSTDEYGNPRTAITTTSRYNWLGGKQRNADALGGVILMGVRLYSPALGRFLSVDPIKGGNANDYDYCTADPINCTDLDGRFGWKRFFHRVARVASVAAFGACVFATAGVCMAAGLASLAIGVGIRGVFDTNWHSGSSRRSFFLNSAFDAGLNFVGGRGVRASVSRGEHWMMGGGRAGWRRGRSLTEGANHVGRNRGRAGGRFVYRSRMARSWAGTGGFGLAF